MGTSDSDGLQCHTDLSTCCSSSQGPHRGDWHFPDQDQLQLSGDVFQRRTAQGVNLYHNSSSLTQGMYRCDIATESSSVNDSKQTVYVGLFNETEGM